MKIDAPVMVVHINRFAYIIIIFLFCAVDVKR